MSATVLLPPDDPELERALAALSLEGREAAAALAARAISEAPIWSSTPYMLKSAWLTAVSEAQRVTAPAIGDLETRVELLTTAALLDLQLPDVSWRIEGLLPDGALAMLSGWSGTWKSWLLHHVAVELARGGKFLDAYRCERGPVLFVQAEENLIEHKRKHSWTIGGTGMTETERLTLDIFHAVGPILLNDGDGLAELAMNVRTIKPAVVMIDSTRQTFLGDENSSEFAQGVKAAFNEIQAAFPCSVLLVHHVRKLAREAQLNDPGQRMRGSGALRAILDQHWAVERSPASFAIFTHEKSRMGLELPPLNFQFNATEGRAWFKNIGTAADPTAKTGATRAIVDLLRGASARTMLRQELLAALSGSFNEDQVDRALKKLVDKKRISKGERTTGTPYTLLDAEVGE